MCRTKQETGALMAENMSLYDDMPCCPLCCEGELGWSTASDGVLTCMSCGFACNPSRAIMLLIHTLQNEVGSLRRRVRRLEASPMATGS